MHYNPVNCSIQQDKRQKQTRENYNQYVTIYELLFINLVTLENYYAKEFKY